MPSASQSTDLKRQTSVFDASRRLHFTDVDSHVSARHVGVSAFRVDLVGRRGFDGFSCRSCRGGERATRRGTRRADQALWPFSTAMRQLGLLRLMLRFVT
jgi:hypothetical protein